MRTIDVDDLEKKRAATMLAPREWFELSGVERHDREISYRHALLNAAPTLFEAYRKLAMLTAEIYNPLAVGRGYERESK